MKPGTRLSHVSILSKAGEGGMGVVYQAQDETLHRPVALKLLPDEVGGDTDQRKRFLRG